MLHYYAPELWRLYGVPFDRLTELCWWDIETMARTVEKEARREQS